MSALDLSEIKNAILECAKNPNRRVRLSDGNEYELKTLKEMYEGYKIIKEIDNEETAENRQTLVFQLLPKQY
jgi:hypothetical protein